MKIMINRATLLLAVAHFSVPLGNALKTKREHPSDLENEFDALHVQLHNTVVGLRKQLENKGEVSPMLINLQHGLERILSDTASMKDKNAALTMLGSAQSDVERIVTPWKDWQASNCSYKLRIDSGTSLEADKIASSLETHLSKQQKAFQAERQIHEKRLKALRIRVSASATTAYKDALEHEDASFDKLSKKYSAQIAKTRIAIDAVKKKDSEFLLAFVHAVYDASVNVDSQTDAKQRN
mmetsp:Transcript_139318/g.277841  ORF Transcript_139318/g.277841 Transcript_139318/m.277841 type:complete len:239 (+) Transcript_139318:46-762(+)|eukprot:CAMPEP_0172715298 /NCGR_PEP_ID=MMETSP1074-20121228/67468_1 /TAXON_ID=2916 /ORGANISM="Ceratium fusus, Strain PA161109" /LENGTH=238 /DNA_ID=CAMNT_0013539869 /DNA_START=41 /DNA_END=757 /DNA_ORIENTATION=-